MLPRCSLPFYLPLPLRPPRLKSRCCCRRCKNPLLRRLFHPPPLLWSSFAPLSPLSNNKSQNKRADILYLFTSKPAAATGCDVCRATERPNPNLTKLADSLLFSRHDVLFPQTRGEEKNYIFFVATVAAFCVRLPNARRGREFQFWSPFQLTSGQRFQNERSEQVLKQCAEDGNCFGRRSNQRSRGRGQWHCE